MTKTKCLSALSDLKTARGYRLTRASKFLSKFPWFSFLMQAPQALYSLTGYGVILGSVMSLATDLFWAPLQLLRGKSVQVRGIPSEDPIFKAARYQAQPAYHYAHGQLFTYEDHWLLLAADIVSMGLLMQSFTVESIGDKDDFLAAQPVPDFVPWHPQSRAGLQAVGIDPDQPQAEPFPDVAPGATYLEVNQAIGRGFPRWLETVAGEFPRTFSTHWFMLALFHLGAEAIDWFNGSVGTTAPVYDPEEIIIARLYEIGVLPRGDLPPEVLGMVIDRSLELAHAAGRELPLNSEIREAVGEFSALWNGA